MITRFFAGCILLTAIVTPALADEYYVVRDTTTKKCTIVEKRPTSSTVVMVGPLAFKTRTEAEGAMKTEKVCVTE
jgi:hypothetical protein